MSAAAGIAIVLPPRERFRAADAGAVALTIRDFVSASRFRDRIRILGTETEPFPGYAFETLTTAGRWLMGRNRAYAGQVIAWLTRHPDIRLVEVHNRIALALRIKQALPDIKVCIHLHNDPQGMGGAQTVDERRHLIRVLDGVYCVSDYVRCRLLDQTGLAGEKVIVIHNALARSELTPSVVRKPWVVFAGRFIPEKGVLELAKALAAVLPAFPEWRAVFLGAAGFGHQAGRTAYEREVYAALAGIAGQIEFRGHVPQRDVILTLAAARISLTPSTGIDAFPRVPLEAMQQGCAVIVSAMGGLPEIAGDAAVVLPLVTPGTLAEALSGLMADVAYCDRVAAACLSRADQFRVDVLVRSLDDFRTTMVQGTL